MAKIFPQASVTPASSLTNKTPPPFWRLAPNGIPERLGTSAPGCSAPAFPLRAPVQAAPPLPQRQSGEGLGPGLGQPPVRRPGSGICVTSPSQTQDSSWMWAPSRRLTPTSTCTSSGCLQTQHTQTRLSLCPPKRLPPRLRLLMAPLPFLLLERKNGTHPPPPSHARLPGRQLPAAPPTTHWGSPGPRQCAGAVTTS